MEEVQKYKLYVGELQKIPEGTRFSFYNSAHKYFLIFSKEIPKGNFIEVTDNIIDTELNIEEQSWLFNCKTTVMVEYMKNQMQDTSSALNDFANILDKELEKEVKQIKKVNKGNL